MNISNGKKIVIDYISNGDNENVERIFEGTYGDLRKIIGEDFNGFDERFAFTLQKPDGTKEQVGVQKMTLSHPFSDDSIVDKITVKPINIK